MEAGPTDYRAAESFPRPLHQNGVSFPFSEVRTAAISDGTSKTYLVGEKFLSPAHYTDGKSPCDNQHIFTGHDCDGNRWADVTQPPQRDQAELYEFAFAFGSAHSNAFHMALCDGAVQAIAYNIRECDAQSVRQSA